MLDVMNVSKRYDAAAGGTSDYVLQDVTLHLEAGECVAITGPSGSGKSTLLNIIGTLDRPTSGNVRLEGRELSELDEKELARVRNRDMGFVFQLHHLLPQCTVWENVLLPTLARRGEVNKEAAQERAATLLKRVGLEERAAYRPGQLSGGERQRAAVVRALINEPRLLLADEPTGSLDKAASENLTELLVELNQEQGVALIVVTHSVSLAERMGRGYELENGRLIARRENL